MQWWQYEMVDKSDLDNLHTCLIIYIIFGVLQSISSFFLIAQSNNSEMFCYVCLGNISFFLHGTVLSTITWILGIISYYGESIDHPLVSRLPGLHCTMPHWLHSFGYGM